MAPLVDGSIVALFRTGGKGGIEVEVELQVEVEESTPVGADFTRVSTS
jgi:hypothetical protein